MSARLLRFPQRAESDERDDWELVRACAHQEPDALAALYHRHAKRVFRLVRKLGGVDERIVDDLVQLTFLRAYESAASFRADAEVISWLIGIAVNVSRRHVRTESRRRTRGAAFLQRLPTQVEQPDQVTERKEMATRAADALRRLPQAQREVFVLCDVEQMRGVDAAQVLGLRVGTLYRRLHEARKRLRAAVLAEER